MKYQDLSQFTLPHNFRGRNPFMVQLWWIVQGSLFRYSPQFFYGFRSFLLRLFGAQVGKKALIRPTVRVTYPWKVKIGDYAWIGDDVVLYSLGEIIVGNHTVISQRSYICGGDHDQLKLDFPIRSKNVYIENEVWIATDVFIAPGVTVKEGAVVGARSSVFSDLPSGMICIGQPCKPVKPRKMKDTN